METTRWMAPWAVAMVLALGVAGIAAADAIRPPPASCPRGSHGRSSHEGPRCEPNRTCNDPHDALAGLDDAGARCPETGRDTFCDRVGLCVVHRRGTAGGRFPNGVTPPHIELDEVVGTCGANDACRSGAHCSWASRCVPPRRPSPSDRHTGS